MWPSDLTLTLTFQGQVWNSLYLGQKWSDCHKINKQTYQLNSKASNVTAGLDLGCDLDLEFSRSNLESAISRPKMVRLPWNKKQTYRTLCLKCDHQFWPSPWPWSWIFQGQIWNLLYLSQKWSDCHETKGKHMDWTLGHWIWHWPWPWLWIFKVKFGICYISAKNGLIVTKWKVHRLNWRPQWPSSLTLAMTLKGEV